MTAYSWPGNVRELEHAVERAVLLAEGKPRIEASDLPPEIRMVKLGSSAGAPRGTLTLAYVEREHIVATLARLQGDRKATAKALGIGDNTLWRKLRAYGMVKRRREPTGA